MDDYEERFMRLAHKVMTDKQPLPVTISISQCWVLISGLQLASRHPDLSPLMWAELQSIGRQFQLAIVEAHPEAAELIEMGWNLDFDV